MDQLVEQVPLQEEKPVTPVQEENSVKPEEQIKIVRKEPILEEVKPAFDAMKAGYDYAAGKRPRR